MPKGWGRRRTGQAAAPTPGAPRPSTDVVLVVLAGPDWEPAARLVRETKAARSTPDLAVLVQVVAVGLSPEDLAEAHRTARRGVTVLALDGPVDPVEAAQRGAAEVEAPVVVVLTPPLDVLDGWLAPLVSALDDPAVLGAQPVLRRRDGALAAAGTVFDPEGLPRPFLAGFPLEDAEVLRGRSLTALSGPAVALRRADLLATPAAPGARGWIDFSLALAATRPGAFRVCPDASVVLRDGSPGPGVRELPPAVTQPATAVPSDASALWSAAGFELAGHDEESRPRLTRRPVAEVREGAPRLRWAIKNPATALSWGERWGDTHFARRLAAALRRAGQHVAIDHRQAFTRETGRFDDVELLLRGLTPHRSESDAVSLLWVISHPDEITAAEVAAHDHVFAAGFTWSAQRAREWTVPIEPLLQATDPELFHPDRAAPDTGHDVVFVGNAREGSRPIVALAQEAGVDLAVYGADWEGHLAEGALQAPYLSNDAVGAVYRAAGIVLNDHWDDMRAAGFLSNRVFDAAAAGARVVTDDIPGLEGLFGRSVQVARSAADVARLAGAPDLDAVFGTDAERRAVAARVHAEHSFDVRAERLLAVALEVRAAR